MSVARDSVVVGVDGSAASVEALRWAVRQAALEGLRVTVVHACGFPAAMPHFTDMVAMERGLRSVGRSVADAAVAEARATESTVGVGSVVTMGSAAEMLVEASETAAMVVLGARGRGTLSGLLLGSVSGAVTRQAHCPVVVVRSPSLEGRRPVVVGVDGTPASSAAVEFAFRSASCHRVPLTVLHATWDLRAAMSVVVDLRTCGERVNLDEEEERLVAETLAGLCEEYPDVTVTERYRRGDPVAQLVEASGEASLVVVGTRQRPVLSSTLLGSVSRGVVERAVCPVAVVRPVHRRTPARSR